MSSLALSSAVFGDRRPGPREWEIAAQHGFTDIELATGGHRLAVTDLEDMQRLGAEIAGNGLRVVSLSSTLSDTDAAFQAAGTLGAKLVVVRTGVCRIYHSDPKTALDAPAMHRAIESAAARADWAGMSLAVEFPASWPAEAVVHFLESLDRPAVGVCLDVGHAHMREGAAEVIEQLSGYVHTIHLHDNGGRADDHRLPFGGSIEWPTVLMELEKTGYRGPLVMEVGGEPDPAAAIARAVGARTRLQAILNDLAQPMVFPE